MATTNRTLSLRLRELRTQRGLTQAKLAGRLGVSAGALRHWEAGRSTPTLVQIQNAAWALRVAPDALLERR
jgi:transcriptional regulator with XRE-family HTH domain